MLGLFSALSDLLLPQRCVLCQSGTESVCGACLSHWQRPSREVMKIDSLPIFATRPYDDLAAHVIAGAKDHHRRWLLPFLLEGMVAAVRPLTAVRPAQRRERMVLVPIPSRTWSVRRRGEDLLLRMAQESAKRLSGEGFDVSALPLLQHGRRVRDQSQLSARERQANLHGAFLLRSEPPSGARLIVVDDVVTTGASMKEALRLLAPYRPLGGAAACSTRF